MSDQSAVPFPDFSYFLKNSTFEMQKDAIRAYARDYAKASLQAKEAEIQRLRALIDSPQTDDWLSAVVLEAAHQQERWGANHDDGKASEDWIFLAGHLLGKACQAFKSGDHKKGLHHIISSSAVMLNWHRNATGENTAMRPGIDSARAAGNGEGKR